VLVVVSLVTAYLVLPPLYSVIQTSLFTTKLTGELDEFTLSYYRDMFRELQVLGPFLNTVYFSVGSALLATLLGGLVAWIVTRTDSPLRGLGYFTAFASFGTPFILYTIGWLLILGKAGPVNSWLRIFFDHSGPVVKRSIRCGGWFSSKRCSGRPSCFFCSRRRFVPWTRLWKTSVRCAGARVWQISGGFAALMLPAFFSVLLLIFIRASNL
jgi:iron(III) transport system permease protein